MDESPGTPPRRATVDPAANSLSGDLVATVQRLQAAVTEEGLTRMALSTSALAASALFVPLWLAAACVVVDAICDRLTLRLMDRFTKAPSRALLLGFFTTQSLSFLAFAAPVTWMIAGGAPAEAFIGLFYLAGALLHIMTVLAILRPLALISLALCMVPPMVANAVVRWSAGDMMLLGTSTLGFTLLGIYAVVVLVANNRLQTALAQAQAASDAASAARERLIATMSHELRTPLNTIAGVAATLHPASPQQEERLALLRDASEDMRGLVDDLLDLSAIDAGGLQISFAPACPRTSVARAVRMHQESAAAKGLRLRFTTGAGAQGWGMISDLRLRQAVGNLIGNAVKYSGSGLVDIRLERTGPSQLTVSVKDAGPGIPEDARARIFEPFTQLATAPGGSGVGLGLPIARELARQMGGDLTLAPSEVGAHFILTIEAHPCPAPPKVSRAIPARLPHGVRILVVDDLPSNRAIARLFLEPMGAHVREEADCAGALTALSDEAFDVVLMDIRMPGIDGAETLARIRARNEDWACVPVVAMTADAGPGDRAQAVARGFDGYVAKPIDDAVLAAELGQVLAQGPGRMPGLADPRG